MITLRMLRAAHARAKGTSCEQPTDSGFMLIYVLMITTIITILVGSTLILSASSAVPAVQASYNQAAGAAANGGLQAFLAYADTQCSGATSSVATCTLPLSSSGTVNIQTDGSYTASYQWSATKNADYYRVTSIGTVAQHGVHATRTLVADVSGGVSARMPDSSYVTQFETQAPDVAQQLFPARTIALNSTAISNAGIPNTGSAVSWAGAQSGGAAGTVNVCNSLYGGSGGRVNNPPPSAPTPYVDWSENGTVGTAAYTDFQPCQVMLGHSTQFLAPDSSSGGLGMVRSNDALLLSNSYPGGTGPTLNQPVYTAYQYDPSVDGACGTTGQNYRTFNLTCAGYPTDIGGTPTGSYTPSYLYPMPAWPSGPLSVNRGGANSACWYVGPTRILLNSDGSALITSPQTTATSVPAGVPLACYGGIAPPATGMFAVSVPNIASAGHGVVYVQNNGSAPVQTGSNRYSNTGWQLLDTRDNPVSATNAVFYQQTPASGPSSVNAYTTTANDKPYTPVLGDNPSTQTDAAWTPQWTSDTSGTTCTTSTAVTDLHFYRCYASSGAYDATAYVDLKSAVKSALSTSPASYATATNFGNLVNSKVSTANSSDANNSAPTFADNRSHRWQVSTATDASATDGCTPSTGTPSTTTSTVAAPINDPMFQNSTGTKTVVTQTNVACYTSTVTLQVGTCNVALVLGACVNVGNYVWGNGTALLGGGQKVNQFKVTESVSTTTTTTTTTASTSSFPLSNDVTPYAAGMSVSGPGDLYVQGTVPSTMALVAQDDVVVTNTLTPTVPTANALEVVAQNNVRVYHPVACTSSDPVALAATTFGFCPNDITGLYSGVLPTAARPDQQYTNIAGDFSGASPATLTNLHITADVYALGNASTTCAEPSGGGGFCGGEFTTDNYNRANGLGTLTVTGGVYMAHHGPVGQEWEIYDTTGQSSRPYSGYDFTVKFQNLATLLGSVSTVSSVLTTTTSSSSVWRIISVSVTS